MIFADLLYRGVRNDDRHDIAKRDRLLDRAGLSARDEAVDGTVQLLRMARREHHLVAGPHKGVPSEPSSRLESTLPDP